MHSTVANWLLTVEAAQIHCVVPKELNNTGLAVDNVLKWRVVGLCVVDVLSKRIMVFGTAPCTAILI